MLAEVMRSATAVVTDGNRGDGQEILEKTPRDEVRRFPFRSSCLCYHDYRGAIVIFSSSERPEVQKT